MSFVNQKAICESKKKHFLSLFAIVSSFLSLKKAFSVAICNSFVACECVCGRVRPLIYVNLRDSIDFVSNIT